jgi:hypothetical protein
MATGDGVLVMTVKLQLAMPRDRPLVNVDTATAPAPTVLAVNVKDRVPSEAVV